MHMYDKLFLVHYYQRRKKATEIMKQPNIKLKHIESESKLTAKICLFSVVR